MRGKVPWVIVACSIVALLAAIYLTGHPPRPRPDQPGAAALPEPASDHHEAPPVTPALAPSKSADIPESTTDVEFRELQQCVYASRELVNAKHNADCSSYEGKPEYQQTLAECLNGWMNVRNRIAAAETALSQCDEADLGKRYFETTKEAARRGNADAQLCYLQGDFFSPEGAQIFTDAEIEEYQKIAPHYVDVAFKRGDWRIVDLLNMRHFHPDNRPVYRLEGIGDRDTQYKMTKLLRLGASGSYARSLEGDLQGMMHPDLVPSAALPPEMIKEGDAWAQQTYTDYFSGVPGLTESPVVCRPGPGRPGSLTDFVLPGGR